MQVSHPLNKHLLIILFKYIDMDKPRALSCSANSILNPVIIGHEISRRNNHSKLSRQDSQLSVKTLIESIENATKQAKTGILFYYDYNLVLYAYLLLKLKLLKYNLILPYIKV